MVQIEEMKDEVDQMLNNMRKRGGGGGDSFQEQNPAEVEAFLSSVDRVSDLVAQLKSAGTDEELAKAKTDADQFVGQIQQRTEKLKKKNAGGGDDDDDDGGYETRVVSSNKSSLNTNRTFHEAAPPMPPGVASASSTAPSTGVNQEEMSQQAFMAAMEKDAEERYQRRLENTRISDEWKEKGNVEFKSGNWAKAEELYSEALKVKKDNTALWTNRAQVRSLSE